MKKEVAGDRDMLVVGDFNIPNEKSELFAAITAHGLKVPEQLLGEHGTNLARDKRYDQILHLPEFTKAFSGVGGVLDFYAGDHRPLYSGKRLGKREFTYDRSDHLPLWVQADGQCGGAVGSGVGAHAASGVN